jgi:hypothetical protein
MRAKRRPLQVVRRPPPPPSAMDAFVGGTGSPAPNPHDPAPVAPPSPAPAAAPAAHLEKPLDAETVRRAESPASEPPDVSSNKGGHEHAPDVEAFRGPDVPTPEGRSVSTPELPDVATARRPGAKTLPESQVHDRDHDHDRTGVQTSQRPEVAEQVGPVLGAAPAAGVSSSRASVAQRPDVPTSHGSEDSTTVPADVQTSTRPDVTSGNHSEAPPAMTPPTAAAGVMDPAPSVPTSHLPLAAANGAADHSRGAANVPRPADPAIVFSRRRGEARRRTTVYFAPSTAERLRDYCHHARREMSEVVDEALRAYLAGRGA